MAQITRDNVGQLRHNQWIYSRTELYHSRPHRPQGFRISSKVKTWKTRPDEFRVSIKFGLYNTYTLDDTNGHLYDTDELEALNAFLLQKSLVEDAGLWFHADTLNQPGANLVGELLKIYESLEGHDPEYRDRLIEVLYNATAKSLPVDHRWAKCRDAWVAVTGIEEYWLFTRPEPAGVGASADIYTLAWEIMTEIKSLVGNI